MFCYCFFFNDTATTEIYTLSLHDALPISWPAGRRSRSGTSHAGWPSAWRSAAQCFTGPSFSSSTNHTRSEEHTSELQSQFHLVCRLLLEKKKKKQNKQINYTENHDSQPKR